MNIIFSRKGVDSSSGGFASPVLPDGRILSLPIPDPRSPFCYGDLGGDPDTAKLVRNLSGGSIDRKTRVHIDPDLSVDSLPRDKQWRPLFGQCGAAQSHLDKLGIAPGDLFIFFGWFRRVEMVRRKWRFVPGAPDLHVIFGWLQVERVIRIDDKPRIAQWMQYHPHCHGHFSGHNTIYLAGRRLQLPRAALANANGAGVFSHYAAARQLTADGRSRSIWSLPPWLHPQQRKSVLSYHTDLSRWTQLSQSTELRTVARGQEFVLNLDHYPEAHRWLEDLWRVT